MEARFLSTLLFLDSSFPFHPFLLKFVCQTTSSNRKHFTNTINHDVDTKTREGQRIQLKAPKNLDKSTVRQRRSRSGLAIARFAGQSSFRRGPVAQFVTRSIGK